MNENEKRKIDKTEIAVKFVVSSFELAIYIVAAMLAGYLVGSQFGPIPTVIGLTLGAVLGLVLAVRRAIKMTL